MLSQKSLFLIGTCILLLIIIPMIMAIISYVRFLMNRSPQSLVTVADHQTDILDAPVKMQVRRPRFKILVFAEILFMGISPIYGGILVQTFYNDIQPFNIEYFRTFEVYALLPILAYWLSRISKGKIPSWVNVLIPYCLIIGLFLFAMLGLHFMSQLTLLGAAIFPYLGFPLLAPIPAILYTHRQLYHHNRYPTEVPSHPFLASLRWKNSWQNLVYLLLFIVTIQLSLLIFQQPLDSLWRFFRESKGFFFSLLEFRY